jgi:hypothetical protein
MWATMREFEWFTAQDIRTSIRAKEHDISINTVRDYITRLYKGRFIGIRRRGARNARVYEIIAKNPGVTPRVRNDGSVYGEAKTQQIWRSIKILKRFSMLDLIGAASQPGSFINRSSASKYLTWLERAGYITSYKRHAKGSPVQYQIVASKCVGPEAPMIVERRSVFDPNLGKTVFTMGDEGDE